MSISTHVLDVSKGAPARGVPVRLERQEASGEWKNISSANTSEEGRCNNLLPEREPLGPGIYRLVFDTDTYFSNQHVPCLYPFVQVTFSVRDGDSRFHLPLLLSPHGYTTYRGS